jgi:lipopolysaccharide biosynthesis protein
MRHIRPIAFYLPQFHPIPENDEWWGRGFTEWRNVVNARPRFRDHLQPHLPADLGFYDLRVPEVQEAQAALARQYGIQGFCYYHYWFEGRRLLQRPVEQLLQNRRPDFPFCLCWANENWSRTWDGQDRQILVAQTYSAADDEAHFRALLPAFRDPRYITIDGRPLFIVYRAHQLPSPSETAARWQTLARAAGLPGLYLAYVEVTAANGPGGLIPGFEAAIEFAPDWGHLPRPLPMRGQAPWRKIARKLGLSAQPALGQDIVYHYTDLIKSMLAKPVPSYLRFPGVTPSWDNSARRKSGARIFHGSTPDLYAQWLEAAVKRFQPPSPSEDFIFINAWNEWAEGSHLEPCQRWGHAYLEATARVLRAMNTRPDPQLEAVAAV